MMETDRVQSFGGYENLPNTKSLFKQLIPLVKVLCPFLALDRPKKIVSFKNFVQELSALLLLLFRCYTTLYQNRLIILCLNISAPDGPPEKVHCVALTSTTIQVSWHPPQPHLRNGLIKGYNVMYAPVPGIRPSPYLMSPKSSRLSTVTTVLDGLEKFTNYSIQVLAFTQGGDGKYSFPVSCITLTDGK